MVKETQIIFEMQMDENLPRGISPGIKRVQAPMVRDAVGGGDVLADVEFVVVCGVPRACSLRGRRCLSGRSGDSDSL